MRCQGLIRRIQVEKLRHEALRCKQRRKVLKGSLKCRARSRIVSLFNARCRCSQVCRDCDKATNPYESALQFPPNFGTEFILGVNLVWIPSENSLNVWGLGHSSFQVLLWTLESSNSGCPSRSAEMCNHDLNIFEHFECQLWRSFCRKMFGCRSRHFGILMERDDLLKVETCFNLAILLQAAKTYQHDYSYFCS